MEVKIVSEDRNALLKRREVSFIVEHADTGSTPQRIEVRRAVANSLKADENMVFVKKFSTKTGTSTAVGLANVYDSIEQAKRIEPEYIVNRNIPTEKPKEGEKKE
jgi:small subunit ribosomal protein S24e